MKIVDLEIHNIRGIRHLDLHPAGKNMVILGPNGAGKSAVVDAIDFLLTGNISRLSGQGTAGITLKKHGHHINAKPKDAYIQAKIQIGGREFVIRRNMIKENELICPAEARPQMEKVMQLARLGHHRLTRREILRFVTAESSKRAEAIQELLNIQEIEKIRLAISSAANAVATRLSAKEIDVHNAESALCAALGISKWYLASAVEVVNRWRLVLGGCPLSCENLQDLKNDLKMPGVSQLSLAVNMASLKEHLDQAASLLSEQAVYERSRQYDQILQISNRLQEKPCLLQDLKVLELLQIGRRLLDGSGKCPLCQAEHPPGALQGLLDDRLRYAQEAQEIQAAVRQSMDSIEYALASLRLSLDEAQQAAQQASLPEESQWLGRLLEHNEALSRQAVATRESYRIGCSRSAYVTLDMPEGLIERLRRLERIFTERFPSITPEQDAWDRLTRLEVFLENWQVQHDELHRLANQHMQAQKLKTKYELARNDVLEFLYEEVCDRFADLYRMLHPDDENHFSARLTPSGGKVDFRVDFHGCGDHPPHALHSEGHQDSMGVCLFLALAERLTQGTLDLIVLDDVVMSVDSGHRRQLGEMLIKKFPQRQFLITTHDRVWATQLRNAGVVKPGELIKFYGWDLERGPLLSDVTDLWGMIEQDLANGDVNAAAARLRWELEEFASHACEVLQARVRFTMDGRLELGDLMPSAIGRYKEFLHVAKNAANSWSQAETKSRLCAWEEKVKQTVAQKEIEQWMINPSVHYNAWANLTPEEFRRVGQAHKALIDLFYCPKCESLVRLVEEDSQPANLRCQCGNFNWNLVEKGKR